MEKAKLSRNTGVRFAVSFALYLVLFYVVYLPVSQSDSYRSYLGLLATVGHLATGLIRQELAAHTE